MGNPFERPTTTEPIAPNQADPKRERPAVTVESATLSSEKHPSWNEDAILRDDETRLYGVFDGVGGHTGGAIASQLAAGFFLTEASTLDHEKTEDIPGQLEDLFEIAQNELSRAAEQDEQLESMSSTGAVVKIKDGQAFIAHAGDSRVYLLSTDGELVHLTLDHTPVLERIEMTKGRRKALRLQKILSRIDSVRHWDEIDGLTMNEREKRGWAQEDIDFIHKNNLYQSIFDYFNSPTERRNIITKSIGSRPDVHFMDLKPGERILLMTDGIHDNLYDEEISAIANGRLDEIKDPDVRAAAKQAGSVTAALAAAAQIRSRQGTPRSKADDMTAILIAAQ